MLFRGKKMFAVLLGGIIILVLVYNHFGYRNNRNQEKSPHLKKDYIIYKSNCKIPEFEPFHEPEAKYLRVSGRKICADNIDFTRQEDNKLLVNMAGLTIFCNGKLKHCEYNDIIRVDDTHIEYSPATIFNGDITVTSEFIRVTCFCSNESKLYKNFHAFVQPKKNTNFPRFNFQKSQRNMRADMLNVIMIGLDSVSRLNSYRQLADTRKFLLNELHAIELYGYNTIGGDTFVNVLALLFGKYYHDIGWTPDSTKTFDEYDQILNTFRRKGYRTMYAEDASIMPIFSLRRQGFNHPPTDYYFRPMSMAIFQEPDMLSADKMCLRGRLYHDFIFNYMHDFIKLYKSEKHFAFIFNSYPSHNQLNSAGRIDYALRELIAKLHSEHLLKDTLLIFFSDHGIRQGKFRETWMGYLEERLPMMYIVPPKWLPLEFPKLWQNLQENRERLTTPFDIHEMLLTALDFGDFERKFSNIDLNGRGISLFAQIPENRSCETATIAPHWCICQAIEKLPVTDTTVEKIATLIVARINIILQPEKEKCACLKLHKIKAAGISRIIDNMMPRRTCRGRYRLGTCKMNAIPTAMRTIYHLTLRTVPGTSIFQAAVSYHASKNRITMEGDISNLILYAKQSACLTKHDLRAYCVCK